MVTEVTLDHEFLMSSYLTQSERALSTMGLGRIAPLTKDKGEGIRVLVGGLGLGYTAAEALKSQHVAVGRGRGISAGSYQLAGKRFVSAGKYTSG